MKSESRPPTTSAKWREAANYGTAEPIETPEQLIQYLESLWARIEVLEPDVGVSPEAAPRPQRKWVLGQPQSRLELEDGTLMAELLTNEDDAEFLRDAANAAELSRAASLESTPPDKWISVQDRMPEYGSCVITYGYWIDDVEKIPFQDIRGYSYHDGWDNCESSQDKAVTHWMPLPTPPAKEERGRKEEQKEPRNSGN